MSYYFKAEDLMKPINNNYMKISLIFFTRDDE